MDGQPAPLRRRQRPRRRGAKFACQHRDRHDELARILEAVHVEQDARLDEVPGREAQGLTVADVIVVGGTTCLSVETLKQRSVRKRQRLVPVASPDDSALLAKYIAQEHGAKPEPDAPLFTTGATRHPFRKGPITPRAIGHVVKRNAVRAGLEPSGVLTVLPGGAKDETPEASAGAEKTTG